MMNNKINSNNGASLFDGLVSGKSKSKDSNFGDILSNKETDKPKVDTNKKQGMKDLDQVKNKPKQEVSKKGEETKLEDDINEEVEVDYKSVLDLIMSLLQVSDEEVNTDDLKLVLEELEGLEIVSDELISNLDLENMSLGDVKNLMEDVLKGEEFSKVLISKDDKVLESLKELVSELDDTDDLTDVLNIKVSSDAKPIKNVVNAELNKDSELEADDDKNLNILKHDDVEEPEIQVKDNTKAKLKEKISNSNEETEVESNEVEGFRTDITTETKVKSNVLLDEVANVSQEVEINEDDVIKQIAEKINIEIGDETTEIKLSLKPKILGDMTMNLEVTKGEIVAKVFVDNQKTKQIIEANLIALQEEIEDSGMEIKTFEVFVGSNNDYEQQDQSQFNFFNKNKQNKFQNKQNKINNSISTNYEAGTIGDNQPSLLLDGQSMDLQA